MPTQRLRIDLVQRVISADPKTGTVRVAIEPDPRRYERREIDGQWYVCDKLDRTTFPEQKFYEDLARFLKGREIMHQPAEIDDAPTYVASRRPVVEAMLDGRTATPTTLVDKSEEFLEALDVNKLGFVILSVDIVGSSRLATDNPDAYNRLIPAITHELSEIVPKFRGYVLKYTGDGLLCYFAEPSFTIKNDLALDCALTMRRMVYDVVNPAAQSRALPVVGIRIGLDSGEAYVHTIGSPQAKRHRDVLGAVVNLATKIQGLAIPGGIYLGDATLRNLHTHWRLICEPVETGSNWSYKNLDGNVYAVHRVKPRDREENRATRLICSHANG